MSEEPKKTLRDVYRNAHSQFTYSNVMNCMHFL